MRNRFILAGTLFVGILLIVACQPVNQPPEVTFVTPHNGDTLGKATIAIKVHATDDSAVAKVEFRIKDSLYATVTSSTADTFTYQWDATNAAEGLYQIKATAYDAKDKTGDAEITVRIKIGGGGGGGETHHDQNIDADETWYPSGNTHYIDATIGVTNNATLTIKPGCVVKFSGDYELRCGYGGSGGAGAIVAVGTADSLITFTSSATSPLPGAWSEIGVYGAAMGNTQFKYCRLEYAGSSEGYGTIYVYGSTIKIDNCQISNSADGGAVAEGESKYSSFTNNTITTCAKYPVTIQANYAGTIGAGNTLTGNASGYDAIELIANTVTESQTWLNHGVPYVLMGTVSVNGAASPVLTLDAGTTMKFGSDVEFRTGYGGSAGAIVAIGTASQPITFTSSATSPLPGSWSEVGVYNAATSATQFSYCNFSYAGSSSGSGTFYVYGATPKFDHCSISQSDDYGVVAEGEAKFSSFTNNTIATCAKYPVNIQANYAGTIGAGNALTGNASGYDGIELDGDNVTESQTWLNHGVPYILAGTTSVSGSSSPELTIAPGTTVKLRSGVEFRCGYGGSAGAIIADGTSGRITFTAAATPPAPGSWDYISFYEAALASSKLVNCNVLYGGGGYGNIYTYNSTPTITGDSIGYSDAYGIYLDGNTYPDTVNLRTQNTFFGNASGNIRYP